MKVVTKLFGFAVAFTIFIHYFCSVYDCSSELIQFCHYTSPQTWHEQLLEHSDIYKESLSPALSCVHEEYVNRVRPPLLRLGSDLNRKVYVPLVTCAKTKYENFDSRSHINWAYGQLNSFSRRIRFYYNVFVKPRLLKIAYKCKLDEYCFKIHNRLGPFLERIRFIWHYLKPYTKKAKVSLEDGYSGLKNFYYQSSQWMNDGVFTDKTPEESSTVSSSDSEVEAETETEDEDENEEAKTSEDFYDAVETLTSTVVVTVTMDDQNIAVASGEPDANDLDVSEQELLQEEINAWFSLIDKQSKNLLKIFNHDVDKYVNSKIEVLEPILKDKTKVLTVTSQMQFQNITRAIQDINCTTSIDAQTGEILYFDKSGKTQLSEYVTRPLMRMLFNDTKNQLETMTAEIKSDLAEFVDEVERKVKVIREDVLEVYEEWGDVMISEWSKRLAYIDVVSRHLDDSEESSEVSADNWKKFLKLKKQVVDARDELAHSPAKLKSLKDFVRKAENILGIITKESGEYTYILRSRANLSFQEREKQEREKFRLEQEAQQRVEEKANITEASQELNETIQAHPLN